MEKFLNETMAWNVKKQCLLSIDKIDEHRIILSFKVPPPSTMVIALHITCPASEKDSYIVECKNRQFSWIDDVNIYCLEKKPIPTKLLTVLNKQIMGLKDDPDTKPLKIEKKEEIVEKDFGFDFEKYKKTKELEALIALSKNNTQVETDTQTNKNKPQKQLFGDGIVGKIIVNEFMKLWDQSRNPKTTYKIDIIEI